ncbi:MAG: hypothetical protein ACRDYZ_13635, partial [Acidimicrobiales bacterium]
MERLVCSSPLLGDLDDQTLRARLSAFHAIADWLATMPGDTWQERWLASGAQDERCTDWRHLVAGSAPGRSEEYLGTGMLLLLCSDVVRPSAGWLLGATSPRRLASSLGRSRDPEGFAKLGRILEAASVSIGTSGPALKR